MHVGVLIDFGISLAPLKRGQLNDGLWELSPVSGCSMKKAVCICMQWR